MFQKILVPVSSEFYSKDVIKRSIFLAKTFNGIVHLLYIIEEEPFQQMEQRSDTHRTHYDRTETHHDLVSRHKQTADNIVFEDAQIMFQQNDVPIKHKTIHGEFSSIVTTEINKHAYDLVVMGYEKGCMIDYRLLDELTIPVWIEAGGRHESILAVCSNLAPNQKVPNISIQLAEAFDWSLSMLYVIDLQDNVEVDKNGIRSPKKPKRDLLFAGQNFVNEMNQQHISVKTVEGKLENETIKEAKRLASGLVIIGREQKKRGTLGLPVKNVKQKMAEKCKYSLLFIN